MFLMQPVAISKRLSDCDS